jgi:ribonuclease HI
MTKYRLNGRCSSNQAEQLAILKAQENIQYLENTEKMVLVSTDRRITLESLKTLKNHTYLIENIRTKVIEMEMQNWKIEFSRIKTHAGHHGNELTDQPAKETATSREISECYKRITKSTGLSEISEHSVTKRQGEWDYTTEGVITKLFFSKKADRLNLKLL